MYLESGLEQAAPYGGKNCGDLLLRFSTLVGQLGAMGPYWNVLGIAVFASKPPASNHPI